MQRAAKASNFNDHYKLLEIEVDADYDQIRTSYVRLAKQLHPDAGGTTQGMQQLNTAYKTLMDSTARAAYDKIHSMHHKASKDLGYREDYTMPRGYTTGVKVTNDEYADYFIDMINRELDQPNQRSWSQRAKAAATKARKSFRI